MLDEGVIGTEWSIKLGELKRVKKIKDIFLQNKLVHVAETTQLG